MNLFLSKPGVMSCAGNSIEELWTSVTSGNQDGIKKVKACNGEEFFAARISDSVLKPSSARYDMRIMQIEEAALTQIQADVLKAKEAYGAERIAVCVGSCDNGTEFSVDGHRKFFTDGEFPADYNLEVQCADYVASFIAEKFSLKGPCATFSTACSSSAGAIIKGAELILAGLADAAVVGGIDIASDTTLIGFNSLEAVSSEITNPFSKNRHGITLGDGAAFFVMTKEPNFDSPSIRLLGWGESADAYHMTSPDPSGAGAEKAIRRALKMAEISTDDVGYINMHGTGTKFNDSMEAKAITAVFGSGKSFTEEATGGPEALTEAYAKVPVSTTKSVTGHTLGAAAALELAICWYALVENSRETCNNILLPKQVWDGEQDPELPVLNIVDKNNPAGRKDFEASSKNNESTKDTADSTRLKVCLSNSFAFGGANACLAIGI